MKGSRYEIGNEGIISSEEIKLILDRYRIGKKPLAKLLGWGETTIIRYMEGDVPTNEYSNKLKTILDDPEYYYDLLQNRKERLTSVAFKKSKKAVLSKIMASKVYAVAYYMVNKSRGELSAGSLQYLLYYCQAFSLALYDREMFQEECGINEEHIPYVKIYEGMKHGGIHVLELGEDYLADEEVELIDSVYDSFIWYGPKAFHVISSYEKSMMKVSRDKYNNKIILKETLKEYFGEILKHYEIKSVKDIAKYPDTRMHDIKELTI
jgi:uncharacterized phage-associated protein